jgi:hypothetical protein
MMRGELPALGNGYSTRPVPSGLMRPMRLPLLSVNQSVPSGAMAIVDGALPAFGSANDSTLPSVVRPRSAGVSHRCSASAIPIEDTHTPNSTSLRNTTGLSHSCLANYTQRRREPGLPAKTRRRPAHS